MLETILVYLFAGWFVKLENITHLIIRASIALLFGIFCLVGTIEIFTADNGAEWCGVFMLVLFLLLALRIFFDVRKIVKLLKEKNTTKK